MFLYGPSKGVRKSVHSRKFGREILIFAVMSQNVMSIWSVQIMDIGLNFIDRRILIFTKVEDAWERKLIITFISCSHLYSTFKGSGPFASVYGSISMNSPEIQKKFITTYLGKRSNMFTFLLVPFALLRQKGKGLSRQGKPFSSTVFHLRESLFSRIQNAENFEELVHYSKPKFCHSNFESQKYSLLPICARIWILSFWGLKTLKQLPILHLDFW